MDRSELLAHLRKTRFSPGDRETALSDARRIAGVLKSEYGAEVYGIGSLFESVREFRLDSDIDLVAKGIPKGAFIRASTRAAALSDFEVDLIPWEDANDLIRVIVESGGVRL